MVTATGSTAKGTSSYRIKQCMPSWITFKTSPAILRLAPVNEAVDSKHLYTSLPWCRCNLVRTHRRSVISPPHDKVVCGWDHDQCAGRCRIQYLSSLHVQCRCGKSGGKIGFIFAFLCFLGLGLSWLYLPETKAKSYEELDYLLGREVPTRQFKEAVYSEYNQVCLAESS